MGKVDAVSILRMRRAALVALTALSTIALAACDHQRPLATPPAPSARPAAPPPRPPPTPSGQILWFDRDPRNGYEWSFFLYFPSGVSPSSSSSSPLLVMPNNTGAVDDQAGVHRAAALKQVFSWRSYAERLHAPILVPTFPRPGARPDLYTHALDRDTLLVQSGDLRRLDLQLIGMIEAAHRFMGAAVDTKILIFGFSAGAMFANRFTLLHPERVLAAAVGSPGGWPMSPQSTWRSERLRYPLGTGDLSTLTGKPLDLDALRRVRFFFFLGANDENDSVTFRDGYDTEDEALAMRLLGRTPVERWSLAERMYRDAGANAIFRLYPDVGHDVMDNMDSDVLEFFANAMVSRPRTAP
jgi:predicted esterase